MPKVLIVDDDPIQLRLTANIAEKDGFSTVTATDGTKALDILRADKSIGAMVLDLVMPDLDGMGVLSALRSENIAVPTIVQTAHSSLDSVISAMRQGAIDFFVKPVAPERLLVSLRNALKLSELESCVRNDRNRREGKVKLSDIISVSPAMLRVFDLARKAARSTIPVMIEGESGVGKEIVARAIQGSSDRAGRPFVTVNCGAIPRDLVESVLFGHVKGAFTGATNDQTGKFEEAHGGTLFLDEIGELPLDAQVKLLRAVQEGEVEPVGAAKPKKVDVRIISATNRRLLNLTGAGRFREDLYYRLNVFPIYVPPLRDRREDILPLAAHFIARLGAEAGRSIAGLSDNARDLLMKYDWPGNVRQLENTIYRAIVLRDGGYLRTADFPQIHAALNGTERIRTELQDETPQAPVHIDAVPALTTPAQLPAVAPRDRFFDDEGDIASLAAIERDLIVTALAHHNGHMTDVARALGIGRSTLYRKLREYGLEGEPGVAAA
ncbi:MAG: sigma-54-dependent Fis family transcriptional regulator [Hyphomicrobiaceae bacterium]|nr:sigma-54-dependent Fis family transcriptional regulator [Hyphomicrobiaceae bacterium]